MKKSIKTLFLAALAAAALTGCSSKAAPEKPADHTSGSQASSSGEAESSANQSKSDASKDGVSYTIGIGQFAEHGSLDNCREGFLLGLAEEGIEEGKNLTVMYENAQADGGTASQIVNNFLSKKVNLICAIATPVTDPVAAALAKEDGTPAGEITGTSDKLPVEKQLEMIRKILPDAKTIGILYSTSEVNSETAIKEYKAAAASYGFEIVEGPVTATADIPLATDSILEKVDCLNNLTDNTVVSSLPLILDKAGKKNIPVFGSEVEQVKIGCLASMGLDYVDLGKQTGKMAAKVLKGEAKASGINFEVIKEAAFYGNSKVADSLGITLPSELTGSAAEIFTDITR